MNAVILKNIELMLSWVAPDEPPTHKKKEILPLRKQMLQYLLAHSKATGAELKQVFNTSHRMPSAILRANLKNGTVQFNRAGKNKDGFYVIAKGMTPRALGIYL
ncbi:MAG: hypothetical protein Q8S71_03905 [Hydrogenophaga sp.]|nr:hypothetical protein [Hydrogenophaga sp.]